MGAQAPEDRADPAALEVQVLPLAPNLALPVPAPAATRERVPSGYGVQEQCLPFTAASALGLLLRSPIAFGLCPPAEAPPGAHTVRCPLEHPPDERVYYVEDDPRCRFSGNAFTLDEIPVRTRRNGGKLQRIVPGLSFFDRPDQVELFKVHLPFAWRTPPGIHCLFLPALNRSGPDVLAGLVETDWYATPVNLVVRRPPSGQSIHVAAGEPIAQVCPIARSQRRPELKVLPPHARLARDLRTQLAVWYRRHAEDRSAYKRMVRERQRESQSARSSGSSPSISSTSSSAASSGALPAFKVPDTEEIDS